MACSSTCAFDSFVRMISRIRLSPDAGVGPAATISSMPTSAIRLNMAGLPGRLLAVINIRAVQTDGRRRMIAKGSRVKKSEKALLRERSRAAA
jgi:hypothetical protein